MIRLNPIPIEPVQSISIKQFMGANLNPDVSQIEDGESPDLLNITLDKDGTPDKRLGYERCFANPLGSGKINGLIEYKDLLIIAHGTKVYKWDYTNTPTEIYSGVTDSAMRGFVFGGKLYLINGHEYLVYDGTTCAVVSPYVPTLTVSTAPTGGGTTLEDWNLLGRGFKQTFNGDNATKT
jgi:hypothetical protein